MRVKISKKQLYNLYWDKSFSERKIGRLFKCHPDTIYRKMVKYNIKRRTRNEFGKLSHRFGKSCPHSKHGVYKNTWMRSSYEIAYAKFLDKSNIRWEYESKRFDLGNTTYCPDFYLPETDEYVEIKGWWWKVAKRKFELFKKIFPAIKIKVLMKLDLQRLGII